MPIAVIEIVSTADRLPVLGYIMAERGQLIGLTAVAPGELPLLGELLVEAGLMKGGRGDTFKTAVAIREYVYLGHPAAWDGNLQLEPGDELYAEVRAALVFRVRLNFLIRIEGG